MKICLDHLMKRSFNYLDGEHWVKRLKISAEIVIICKFGEELKIAYGLNTSYELQVIIEYYKHHRPVRIFTLIFKQ